MQTFRVDGSREFISVKLKNFYEKQSIVIKYATSYMHKGNGLAGQK